MQKNILCYFAIISIALYRASMICMESSPPQQFPPHHHPFESHPTLFPPTHQNKPILGFEIKDLAQLAPIAMVMYCFNELPRFTMISLSAMLIYTITRKEIFKKTKQKVVQAFKKFFKKNRYWFTPFFL